MTLYKYLWDKFYARSWPDTAVRALRLFVHCLLCFVRLLSVAIEVWYVIGVVTLRALVRASNKTSGDARSWYMISGDAKSWVWFAYIHCHIARLSNCALLTTIGSQSQGCLPQCLLTQRFPPRLTKLKAPECPIPLMGEEFMIVESSGTRTHSSNSSASSDSTAPLSPDHPLTHVSPTPTPTPTRASFH
ncbi:hypothetical protein Tco_1073645, partial [Tanacetum coccineum]